ncbi:hypothetical protein FG386_001275 [Cryptosporidium ryanae]|uniref:uncharacterized protein n=1 Tax=Cryptosporidium ryanae TaxID=515981 RepID=UPI003519EBEE|nr:hypothetical protein FG386_001275 [Cryptosporidium ryanae]
MEVPLTETSSLEVCLSNLISSDISTISEEDIEQIGVNNLQIILNKVCSDMKKERSKEGVVVTVPIKQEIQLPRAFPLPEKREKTKWEKFAELKGIKKRKRSRMVYDPITDDFVPRWGRNSIKKIQKKHNEAIIEIKGNIDSAQDPRNGLNSKRNIVISKQKLRELKNKMRNSSPSNNNGGTVASSVIGIGNIGDTNIKRNKSQVNELYNRVSLSTASYGRKDKALQDEDQSKNKIKKVKKNIIDTKDEGKKYKSIYNRVMESKSI